MGGNADRSGGAADDAGESADRSEADADGAAADATADPDADADLDVVLIAAVAENGVVGRDGGMPWHYPADLRRFKQTTMGHPVVIGRRTYESIADRLGGPLPGRTNVVLTRGDPDVAETVVLAGSVDAAIDAAAATGSDTAYVAGGATVYEQFLDRADRMRITEIPESPDGDTRFPDWDPDDWREVEREAVGDLAFVTYERRAGRR